MPPKDPRHTNSIIPARSYLRLNTDDAREKTNEAAANIIRNQIENIYKGNTASEPAATVAQAEDDNPYDRTHEPDRTELEEDQWKHYHSAWQDYYRQYYHRYYLGEVYRMRQNQSTGAQTPQPVPSTAIPATQPREAENDEAFRDLRSDLLRNVRVSAAKVRKSRHFMPIVAAGLAAAMFLFIEFNPIIIGNVEAYVSPGNIDPANIITDPMLNIPVSADPRLIIPKINVDIPVIWDTTPDQASQLAAMEKGVSWFGIPGANSHPGQVGNTVIAGHSSNDWFGPGGYKFIFARLDQLMPGDTFYINYQSVRYTYSVTRKEVVRPTDVQKLVYPTDKPLVTLLTCTPVGTAISRLLVTAEQVSPSPTVAKPAPSTSNTDTQQAMPGNASSLLNRLFGG